MLLVDPFGLIHRFEICVDPLPRLLTPIESITLSCGANPPANTAELKFNFSLGPEVSHRYHCNAKLRIEMNNAAMAQEAKTKSVNEVTGVLRVNI